MGLARVILLFIRVRPEREITMATMTLCQKRVWRGGITMATTTVRVRPEEWSLPWQLKEPNLKSSTCIYKFKFKMQSLQ